MKSIIPSIIVSICLLSSGGCAVIGIETIFPQSFSFNQHQLNYDLISGDQTPLRINLADVHTKSDVIQKLGKPDKETRKYIFYSDGKRDLRGIAIDVAVIVPISIPLVLPVGKSGVKFWHDKNGNLQRAIRYRMIPTFYGFYTNCGEIFLGKKDEFSMYFE